MVVKPKVDLCVKKKEISIFERTQSKASIAAQVKWTDKLCKLSDMRDNRYYTSTSQTMHVFKKQYVSDRDSDSKCCVVAFDAISPVKPQHCDTVFVSNTHRVNECIQWIKHNSPNDYDEILAYYNAYCHMLNVSAGSTFDITLLDRALASGFETTGYIVSLYSTPRTLSRYTDDAMRVAEIAVEEAYNKMCSLAEDVEPYTDKAVTVYDANGNRVGTVYKISDLLAFFDINTCAAMYAALKNGVMYKGHFLVSGHLTDPTIDVSVFKIPKHVVYTVTNIETGDEHEFNNMASVKEFFGVKQPNNIYYAISRNKQYRGYTVTKKEVVSN